MAANIRQRMATVTVAAGLMGGLVACGPLAQQNDGAAGPVSRGTTPTAAVTPEASVSPTTTPSAATPAATPTTAQPKPTPAATPTTAQPRPTPSAKVTATPKPRPSATTPKPKPSTPPSTTTPTTPPTPAPVRDNLLYGDRGPKVLAMQQRLSELGYWLGEPDGHYGFLTQQAVWAFQKSAGLSRDGDVGPATQRALKNGVRPATRLQGNGIDINLERQILMIVRGGEVRYILNTSTGGGYKYKQKDGDTATARTPKGTFNVYHSVNGKDEGFLGDMWRPRYFNGGYAVHGSGSIPNYPASHGCARVSNAAMNMIWARDFMPQGGTVLVR